jgi:integrase
MATGIRQRHRKDCNRRGKCDCTWQAEVFDAEAGQKIRKTFPSYTAARNWRHDALVALREGRLRAVGAATLDDIASAWLQGAEAGNIRARGGDRYKPATIRAYDRALRLRVLPQLGDRRVGDIRRTDVQALVDDLLADELAAATIHTTVAALQTVCRHELRRGRLKLNPADKLELPAVRNGREHVVGADTAARLLAALTGDRALWATAMYAGLRRGELRALRASDVDLAAGVIRVERSVDDKTGVGPTKGRNKRRVPIPDVLRRLLREQLMATGHRGDQLLFGSTPDSPFAPSRVTARADKAWKAAGLERITLHEARHCYASYAIAAGVNLKALSTFMGHARIAITLDLYGHLLPGSEDEAAGLLDTYLGAAR